MRFKKASLCIALLIACSLFGCQQDQPATQLIVNLMVDAEQDDVTGLSNMINELEQRGIKTTVYVTGEYANKHAVAIEDLYNRGFEIALHGYYTGEQLATMTYEEQKDLLERAKEALEGCLECGTAKPIIGFRPQYFSQNEDTYRILDELGLTYNSGFKAGELFLEGHDNDSKPYEADGYNFYAVPITTVEYNGERVYLCDIASAQSLKLTADQWWGLLSTAIDQAAKDQTPLVVLMHGWYTGDKETYTYWEPFIKFLDSLEGRAQYVTTKDLVEKFKSTATPIHRGDLMPQ